MSRMLKLISTIVVLGTIAGLSYSTYYFYNQNKKAQSLVSNPQEISKRETAEILAKVSKIMELPSEEPSVATVLEADKLKDQPFFAKAMNGDKVLIFAQAKKAILYRPSTNKIIEVGPIDLPSDTTQKPTPEISKAKATPTPEPTAADSAAN